MGNGFSNVCICQEKHEHTDINTGEYRGTEDKKKIIKIQTKVRCSKNKSEVYRRLDEYSDEFETKINDIGEYVEYENICKKLGRDYFKQDSNLVFYKKPIKLKDGNIYDGHWSFAFKRKGYGCLYMKSGVMIEGIWDDNCIKDVGYMNYSYNMEYIGKIDNYYPCGKGTLNLNNKQFEVNWLNHNNEIVVYANLDNNILYHYNDYSLYEGHTNKLKQRHGNGRMYYNNAEIYIGEWKNDKQHGVGINFTPNSLPFDNNLIDIISRMIKIDFLGVGTYIRTHWTNGQMNGNGITITNNEVFDCTWRYGKLVDAKAHSICKSFDIDSNIIQFLNEEDKHKLLKLKNKKMMIILSKQIKTGKGDTVKDKIMNMQDLPNEIYKCYNVYLPFVGYRTNGGFVRRRFHYSNLFNPNSELGYFSDYTRGKTNDIIISGSIDEDNLSTNYTNDNTLLIESSKKYQYNTNDYDYNYHHINVYDSKYIKSTKHFILHSIYIDLPYKLTLYTYLINPVKTLAVYIHDEPNIIINDYLTNEFIEKNFGDLTNNSNFKMFSEKMNNKHKVINTDINDKNSMIEFDTQIKSDYKLLAVIVMKDYHKNLFQLKQHHHAGKYITIKLIDQRTLKDYKKTSIEIGTMSFFGQIIKL